jgi:hypothetical protein
VRASWLQTATAWWVAFAATAAILLVPLFLVDIPPLLDYPNHLARVFVLSAGAKDPVIAHMYAPHWALLPNLAFDVVMQGLVRVFPLYVAGRVALGLMLVLQLSAVTLYSRALFKERSYWPLVAAFVLYGGVVLLGIVGFMMSMGVALLTAAWWIHARERWPRWAVVGGALGAVLVYFCHIFCLPFLAVLIGSYELDVVWRRFEEKVSLRESFVRRLLPAAAVFVLPAALVLLYAPNVSAGAPAYPSLAEMAGLFSMPFVAYHQLFDVVTGMVLIGFIGLCCTRGRAVLPRSTAIQLIVLTLAYVAVPFRVNGASWIDVRCIYMATLVVFAGILPVAVPRRIWAPAACIIASLFIVKMVGVNNVWLGHRTVLASFRHVIAPVAPGDKVLLVRTEAHAPDIPLRKTPVSCHFEGGVPACLHVPSLLLIERRAFWPFLFSVPWEQPVRVLPPYDRLSIGVGDVPDYRLLKLRSYPPPVRKAFPYLPDWQKNFDYVLVLTSDAKVAPSRLERDSLTLVRQGVIASLFRIDPVAKTGPGARTAAAR